MVMCTGNPLPVTMRCNIANTQGITQVPMHLQDPNLPQGQCSWDIPFFKTGDEVWQVPERYNLGDVGVRSLPGPSNQRWDFAVYKRFLLAEDQESRFGTEIFNATNHPNMGNPGTQLGNASFGRVTGTWGLDRAREIQFGLKFIFQKVFHK